MTKRRRIAVLRALQLGDMLCVVPALRALRRANPDAEITLIGLPWAASFVERYRDYLDDLMVLPPVPGMPEQRDEPNELDEARLASFMDAARKRRFDLAIQLHGSGTLTNGLLAQVGARHIAGFYAHGHPCPDRSRFLIWQEAEHEVLRALRLMRHLGFLPMGEHLEFPVTADDHAALAQACPSLPDEHSYVCIHPGARMLSRRWPWQRFAAVADRLAEQGLQVVLTGAPDEAELVEAVVQEMQMPAINLAGKTTLGALALLVSRAALVICNDTGMSHVAAAVRTPSVVICSGADPGRWAPLDHALHRVLAHPVYCRPCMYQQCPIGHPCALGTTVDAVVAAALQLLPERASPFMTDVAFHAAMPAPAVAPAVTRHSRRPGI